MEIITPKPGVPRMIIYGKHKIGKSSFASSFPNAIFIDCEGGLGNLDNEVKSFPMCKTFNEFAECMKYLITENHGFKTLVIDSIDWLELLIFDDICPNWKDQKGNAAPVDQIDQIPYGAGKKKSLAYWERIVKGLKKLNEDKGMIIVLLAHSKTTKFEDPTIDNYNKVGLDIYDKAAAYLCEHVDLIGYCCERTAVVKSKEGFGEVTKVKSTGQRLLRCTSNPAYEAGNRYGLPDNLELSWDALNAELKKHYAKKKETSSGGNLVLAKKEKAEKKEESLKQIGE